MPRRHVLDKTTRIFNFTNVSWTRTCTSSCVVDAIPQLASSPPPLLTALFAVPANVFATDAKLFGQQLTEQLGQCASTGQATPVADGKPQKQAKKVADEDRDVGKPEKQTVVAAVPTIAVTTPVAPPLAFPISQAPNPILSGDTKIEASDEIPAQAAKKVTPDRPKNPAFAPLVSPQATPSATASPIDESQTDINLLSERPQTDDLKKTHKVETKGAKVSQPPVRKDTSAGRGDSLPTKVEPSSLSVTGAGVESDLAQASSADSIASSVTTGSLELQPEAANVASASTNAQNADAPRELAQMLPTMAVMDAAAGSAAQAAMTAPTVRGKGSEVKTALPGGNAKADKDRKGADKPISSRQSVAPGQTSAEPASDQIQATAVRPDVSARSDVSLAARPAASPTHITTATDHPSSPGQTHPAEQGNAPEASMFPVAPVDVVHAVRMFQREGQAEMHFGVRSESLGSIDVKTAVRDSNVGVSIAVERHEVRSALLSELPALESTLRDHDLRLGEVKFHDTASLASGYGGGQQRQSQDLPHPSVPALFNTTNTTSETADTPSEMAVSMGRGGISVHV